MVAVPRAVAVWSSLQGIWLTSEALGFVVAARELPPQMPKGEGKWRTRPDTADSLGPNAEKAAYPRRYESRACESQAMSFQPRYIPQPYQDAPDAGRVILRDGTTAQLRPATPADLPALQAFFERLSLESRWRRFSSLSLPQPELLAALCDSSRPREKLSLLVWRAAPDGTAAARIVAIGSYVAKDATTAEVSFAVDDAFQGKGLGTLLLERLALLAARHGFTRFWAVTHADNRAMQEVFRESGFALTERWEQGELEVDLSVLPSAASVAKLEMRDRVATAVSLRPFFHPRAVAVIGASRDPASIGHRIVDVLKSNRFQGPIYPINPKAAEIAGLPAYASLRAAPRPIDLAIVAVPRDVVLDVVDECAAVGVRGLVVITAGFAEVGGEGRELQQRLVERVRGHGLRLVGPNCMGLLNADPAVSLNASFAPVFPPAGRVAMSSQSGALGLAILSAAKRFQLGLSTFVSVGNKADVSGNDLLQYWEEDPATDVILLYLESFGNPRRFARIARRVSQRKPIVALKSGRTKAGGRAAGSHTAALATSDATVDALFQQTGVIRADTIEEMFDLALTLGNQPLPAGKRVGIITNAGGPGILCAGVCEASGLTLPEFSPATRAKLATFLPAAAGTANPVDLIASAAPDHFRQAINTVLSSGEIDALIVIYIPVGLVDTPAITAAVGAGIKEARTTGTATGPVLMCLMEEHGRGKISLNGEAVPSFAFPEAPARALAKVAAYADWRRRPSGIIPDFDNLDLAAARRVCTQAAAAGPNWLSAEETAAVLHALNLPLVPSIFATTAEEAVAAAERLGYPVAVKLASRTLVHKTEVEGVKLKLNDATAVRAAFAAIRARLEQTNQLAAMEGVVVQPMLFGGVELMVGVAHDPLFGPVIAFGLGGIHVEVLGDVCFRVTPLTDRDAADMVRSIRGHRLLEGYRGHPAADVAAVEELLLRVSRLVEEIPEISDLDLNPVFAMPPGQGCKIVDARIRVTTT
ncbi:MAG: GNAT family N-acetyltransferase [Gemmataceae bacterium]|nr:GNAT family N-acetyltransferase [Gemmataceae bacterium]